MARRLFAAEHTEPAPTGPMRCWSPRRRPRSACRRPSRHSSPPATASSSPGRRFATCSARCAGRGWRWAWSQTAPRSSGRKAVACTGIAFDVVVTAERAGYYKPDPRPYRMALDELGIAAGRCLFVAGSAYDLFGTQRSRPADLLAQPARDGAAARRARADGAAPLAIPAPRRRAPERRVTPAGGWTARPPSATARPYWRRHR